MLSRTINSYPLLLWLPEVGFIGHQYRHFTHCSALSCQGRGPCPESQVGQRRRLQIINIMNNDGSLNESAGRFAGMDRSYARSAVWSALEVRQCCMCCQNTCKVFTAHP